MNMISIQLFVGDGSDFMPEGFCQEGFQEVKMTLIAKSKSGAQ